MIPGDILAEGGRGVLAPCAVDRSDSGSKYRGGFQAPSSVFPHPPPGSENVCYQSEGADHVKARARAAEALARRGRAAGGRSGSRRGRQMPIRGAASLSGGQPASRCRFRGARARKCSARRSCSRGRPRRRFNETSRRTVLSVDCAKACDDAHDHWYVGNTHERGFARDVADRVLFIDGGASSWSAGGPRIRPQPARRHARNTRFPSRVRIPCDPAPAGTRLPVGPPRALKFLAARGILYADTLPFAGPLRTIDTDPNKTVFGFRDHRRGVDLPGIFPTALHWPRAGHRPIRA